MIVPRARGYRFKADWMKARTGLLQWLILLLEEPFQSTGLIEGLLETPSCAEDSRDSKGGQELYSLPHLPEPPMDSASRDSCCKMVQLLRKMETHRIYKQKLEELTSLQTSCSSSISKQKTRLKDLKHALQRYKKHASREEAELIQQMSANIKERQNIFFDMEAYLPKKNGLYLNLVLGNVNVTLLSNQAKFAYKDEYEKFKLYLTIILLLGAVACRFVLHYRVTDEVFNFLLVWYYCTLTIRESILISNGSRIKGWWVSHHYVSTFLSGVMLTWPNGLIYQKFRNQFLAFSIFQSCVQFLQYYYQRGCLYRLRALGERNHLDLTKDSSPGCGAASPSSCLSCSVAISGSSTTPSHCLSSPATRNAENGRCSCWRSRSSSSSWAIS
ncbi:transmembrane protein 120B isoform X3 [Ailuropoda melanoleuca]|uniref:transmembrane protein 120B isoform X3 n=1 Tax=Ailuropoda melanoleuca TaxID=9646 RepID=UPI0014941F9D|nr:transmembrane protein 120B isoform X3 [Ailuropoda melanoleuca]